MVEEETGFVISKDEEKLPQELADRVIQLLENDELAQELGKKGRRRVEQKFHKSRMARDLINLSETLLAETRGAGG